MSWLDRTFVQRRALTLKTRSRQKSLRYPLGHRRARRCRLTYGPAVTHPLLHWSPRCRKVRETPIPLTLPTPRILVRRDLRLRPRGLHSTPEIHNVVSGGNGFGDGGAAVSVGVGGAGGLHGGVREGSCRPDPRTPDCTSRTLCRLSSCYSFMCVLKSCTSFVLYHSKICILGREFNVWF